MKTPDFVSPGQPISAKAFNDLVLYVRSLQLRSSPGVRVHSSMAGTTLEIPGQQPGRAGIASITHPFLVADATASGVAGVSVRSGSVNDAIPGNIATVLTFASAGTWRVYLDCTLSDDAAGTVTAVALAVTNGAQPVDTRTHAYLTLATATVVAVDGGFSVSKIDQLATHSLRFFACSRTTSANGTYNFWGF